MKAPLEKTKDIEIEGERYQLCRMNPRTGSWIVAQLCTRLLPGIIETKLASVFQGSGMSLPAGREQITEQEFHNLQDHCLLACKWYDPKAGVPIPILTQDGRFAVPALEDDLLTVMTLTAHVLIFNVAPFFAKGRIETMGGTFQWVKEMASDLGLKLPDTPLSTSSASGQ